ncbi:MAG: branched-chain amino acid ABC transporter permease [Deltaproteobacteria bacterium]|nr:branched-chain amino acid ABC transporter permease [Deltaproteobacteria bacterium]
MSRTTKWILWLAGVVVLVIYPHIVGIYFSNFIIDFGIIALFSVSYNLLLGFTGLLSFGHAIFFAAGGYGTALVLEHITGVPLIPALLMGAFSSAFLALILCPIVSRVKGSAFAMLHLAFNFIMWTIILQLRNITGGEDGIAGYDIPPFNIPGIVSFDMTDPMNFYYFAVVVLAGSIWLAWFLTKTPFGQIMVGVRDNDIRVNFLGFRVVPTKAIVYIIAAAFAGVAGGMSALFQNMVSAADAEVVHSFKPILATIVGGASSFFGPIIGAGIFALLEELTSRFTEQVELVQGIVLVVVILYFPKGFIGLVQVIREKLTSRRVTKKVTEEYS